MLNHISFPCSDLKKSIEFYDRILKPLGYVRVWSNENAAGWGIAGEDEKFAVKFCEVVAAPGQGFHLAFSAPTRLAVEEFFNEALILGASSSGGPGLRLQYGPTYYAAFVSDLDGFAIEAVCHATT